MATATKSLPASSVAGISGMGERCDLGASNARRGLPFWAERLPAAVKYSNTGFDRF